MPPILNPVQNNRASPSPSYTPTMPPQTASFRRTRPSQVQTSLPMHGAFIPPSAISASSLSSSFMHGSPILSPDTAGPTASSSVQPSPEPLRGRDVEPSPLPPLQLPESLLSRKTSTNSLGYQSYHHVGSFPASGTAMSEALKGSLDKVGLEKAGIIRRISTKAQRSFSRRRQSSAAPSRDGSVGPGFRRRSDSTTTAPADFAIDTDSEDEQDVPEDASLVGLDGNAKGISSGSTAASLADSNSDGSRAAQAGPVVPLSLTNGTMITKVSKKNKSKRIVLVLDVDSAKITWDKNRRSKVLYIDDIEEIRTGQDVAQYMQEFGIQEAESAHFFSIIYALPDKSGNKMMHLLADDMETKQNWVETLDEMSNHRQELMLSLMAFNDKAIRSYWAGEMRKQLDLADRERAGLVGKIDLDGVERMCKSLHIHVSKRQLTEVFNGVSSTGFLTFTEFQEFVKIMKRRSEITKIYHGVATEPDLGITFAEFVAFLRATQCESIPEDALPEELAPWEAVFAKFSRRPKPSKEAAKLDSPVVGVAEEARMSEAMLAGYLTSTFNVVTPKEPESYTLDRPMNEYFISSSHNTYLTGRQVYDESSTEVYRTALKRGCRCVEVDCWDGNDGQPIVTHGRSMTTQVRFQDVMNVINKHAFDKSPFPLWISLEVHCSPMQQAIMTQIMKDTLGARLVTEPLDPTSDRLPSPSELIGRILVKVKKPSHCDVASNGEFVGRRRGASLTSPHARPTMLDGSPMSAHYLGHSPMMSPGLANRRAVGMRVNTISEGVPPDSSSSNSDGESSSEKGTDRKAKKKGSNITSVLGALGVYCHGIKFQGFDHPSARLLNHIYSFMESTFTENSKTRESKNQMYRHNMRYMMRVYPERTRFTSSNFDPLVYWRRGVQMAALNWQTFDLGMQLNTAMFLGGKDSSGYVLKPSEMREIQVLPDNWDGKLARKTVTFTIDVISAQQLIRPTNLTADRTLNPYVEIEVFHANDKRNKKSSGQSREPVIQETILSYQTKIAEENGFNPTFNTSKPFMVKLTTKYPDLVFVRWSVKLSPDGQNLTNSPPVATFTAKLNNLKQGYRTLPLIDHYGARYLFSTLFCHIKVEPFRTVFLDRPEPIENGNGNKFSSLRKTVFNRASNRDFTSSTPKTSMDSSLS